MMVKMTTMMSTVVIITEQLTWSFSSENNTVKWNVYPHFSGWEIEAQMSPV